MIKLAILIPTTSKGRPQWKTLKDTYLYNLTIRSYLNTYSTQYNDQTIETIFYIGIDKDDPIWSNTQIQNQVERFLSVMKNVSCKFISMDGIEKGYLTKMWNRLFKRAYDEQCDYFFQCGDDIQFRTKHWVDDSIRVLKEKNELGLTGPLNNNTRILTQAMVSRKHMEIFGYFFPEELKNWCCDDWYNYVYRPNLFFPLKNHICTNDGGVERYDIDGDPLFRHFQVKDKMNILRKKTSELILRDKEKLNRYINQHHS